MNLPGIKVLVQRGTKTPGIEIDRPSLLDDRPLFLPDVYLKQILPCHGVVDSPAPPAAREPCLYYLHGRNEPARHQGFGLTGDQNAWYRNRPPLTA